MGDSGRQEDYEGDRRIWRIDVGGAVYWVTADSASAALESIEEFGGDDDIREFRVRMLGPRELVRVQYPDEGDIEDVVREWPREHDDSGLSISASACEWAAVAPSLLLCSEEWI